MVDDIRVRGSGKSGIRSEVQAKAGQKSPNPIKVCKACQVCVRIKKEKHSKTLNTLKLH